MSFQEFLSGSPPSLTPFLTPRRIKINNWIGSIFSIVLLFISAPSPFLPPSLRPSLIPFLSDYLPPTQSKHAVAARRIAITPFPPSLLLSVLPLLHLLLPFNGGRGLGRTIIGTAVDALDLIDNAGGDPEGGKDGEKEGVRDG